MRARGLVEFGGTPLIAPRLEIGELLMLSGLEWATTNGWISGFRWKGKDIELEGTICAPPGERGVVCRLAVANGERQKEIRLGLDITWNEMTLTIFSPRPLNHSRYAGWDSWTRSFVCESSGGQGGAAFAVGADAETENQFDGAVTANTTRLLRLEPKEKAAVTFFVRIGARHVAFAAILGKRGDVAAPCVVMELAGDS